MNRITARLVLVASLLLGTLPAGAVHAQGTPVWTEKMSEGFVLLSYGSLDSEQPVLQLSCFNEMEIAVLNIFGAIEGARPGQKLAIELSAGSVKASLDGEASLDDKTGAVFAEASGIEVKPVLAVLGIPPILTNTFVGVRQADRSAVTAARGVGMTEFEILRKVELPMAVPGIMTGVRGSTVNIVATATIAPLVGVATLGEFILGENVYGTNGVLAGAICTAILALIFEFALAGLQRQLTSKGLRLRQAQ